MLRVFMFICSTSPLAVSAGQLLLHAPSRGSTSDMITAPPLEHSPEYTYAPRKHFYLSPVPRAKQERQMTPPPTSLTTAQTRHEQVRSFYTPQSTSERTPLELFSQAKKCNGKFIEEGLASWYGPGFHGRTAANGKRYDQNALTIAHKELPFGLRICIRNPQNKKEVTATVTDRGPYWQNRKFDLSKRTAEELGIIGPGTAYVQVYLATRE